MLFGDGEGEISELGSHLFSTTFCLKAFGSVKKDGLGLEMVMIVDISRCYGNSKVKPFGVKGTTAASAGFESSFGKIWTRSLIGPVSADQGFEDSF